MNLRRAVADVIDPGRLLEVRDLRDRASKADIRRASTEVCLLRLRMEHTAEMQILQACLADAERELRDARADVARLLEAGAQCAHQHHT